MARTFGTFGEDITTGTVTHGIGTGDFTFGMWVHPTNIGATTYQIVMSNGAFDPALNVRIADGSWGMYFAADYSSGNTLTANNTYHLVWQRESSTLKFFQDGTQTGTTHTSITRSFGNAVVTYANNASDSNRFVGDAGDSALWDVALSDDEILSWYRGTTPNRIRSNNLVFYHPMDGTSPEADLSGNQWNGTVNNSPPVVDVFYPRGRYVPFTYSTQTIPTGAPPAGFAYSQGIVVG